MSEPDWPASDFAFDEETLEDALVVEDRARRAFEEMDAAEPGAAEDPRDPLVPRPEPCATCPYRCSAPAGLWAAKEYVKLEVYDGSTTAQAVQGAIGVFYCHSTPEKVCAGWAAVHGHPDSLALRIASARGHDVSAVLAYETGVPLFGSGHEAAAHGLAGIDDPGEDARAAAEKITEARTVTGKPVRFS